MRSRWLLFHLSRPLSAPHAHATGPPRPQMRFLVGRASWYFRRMTLGVRATWTLITEPFLALRREIQDNLTGYLQPLIDVAFAGLLVWHAAQRKNQRDEGLLHDLIRTPLEQAWAQQVLLDRAPPAVPLGTSCLLYSAPSGHNMLVYRIPQERGGGLVLHNCVFLTDAQLSELQAMGPIKAILCPTRSEMPRCMHFGAKLGADVYMPRLMAVPTMELIGKLKPPWCPPLIAEECSLEERFGVKVHEPSGTKGHNRDGHTFPAENFYEFVQPDGSCLLACGTILSDTDYPYQYFPLHQKKMREVTVPSGIVFRGLSCPTAFEAFLRRMQSRRPTHIIPAVGAVVDDPPPVLLRARQAAQVQSTLRA